MKANISISHDPYIRKALSSCIHEAQVCSWINWVERISLSSGIKMLYANMGISKLEELNKELEEFNEII